MGNVLDQGAIAALNIGVPATQQNLHVLKVSTLSFPSFVLIVTWSVLDRVVIAARSTGAPATPQNLHAPKVSTFPSFVPIAPWSVLDRVVIAAQSMDALVIHCILSALKLE